MTTLTLERQICGGVGLVFDSDTYTVICKLTVHTPKLNGHHIDVTAAANHLS